MIAAVPKQKSPKMPQEPASSCPYKYVPSPASTRAPPPGPPIKHPKLDKAKPMPMRVPIFLGSNVRSARVAGNIACNPAAKRPYSIAKAYMPDVVLMAIQQ